MPVHKELRHLHLQRRCKCAREWHIEVHLWRSPFDKLRASLGSTSMLTDADGSNPITTLYKAWGEVRYSSGSLPTKYTYTGQRSFAAEIGLMFYNARCMIFSCSK